MARTSKWRRYPAKTADWPPVVTIIPNTPSGTQTRVQVDNPLAFDLPVVVEIDPTDAGTNEVQSLTAAALTGGKFTVVFDGQETEALDWNATAAQVQAALRALPNVGATGVTAGGGPLMTAPVTLTFGGPLAGTNVAAVTTNITNTEGGVDEVVTLVIDATDGTFTLTFDSEATDALDFDIAAEDLQTALEGLESIGAGNVEVSGGPGASEDLTITFVGDLGETNVGAITADDALLTGGDSSATVTVATAGAAKAVAVATSTPGVSSTASTFTAHTVPAETDDHNIDVTHDEEAAHIRVRLDSNGGQILAQRAAGAE